MTKPARRHDETWAIGKGLTLWNDTPLSRRGFVYTETGIILIELSEDKTQIDCVVNRRLHRRIINKRFEERKAVAEAHRFAKYLERAWVSLGRSYS